MTSHQGRLTHPEAFGNTLNVTAADVVAQSLLASPVNRHANIRSCRESELVRAACPPRSVDRAYALAIATETSVATTGNTNASRVSPHSAPVGGTFRELRARSP